MTISEKTHRRLEVALTSKDAAKAIRAAIEEAAKTPDATEDQPGVVKMAPNVAAVEDSVTAENFNDLLSALIDAGIMAPPPPEEET